MCSVKKVFLEISQNPQENTYARVPFFNKVAGLRSCSENIQQVMQNMQSNFIETSLRHGCSPVNLLHISEHLFLRTPLMG